MEQKIYKKLVEELEQIPIIDVHSHLDPERPQAKDIGDILFYHFLRREISSAGGDDTILISGRPLAERVSYFLRCLPLIQNTTTYWCVRKILKDLYGLNEGLNEENWKTIEKRIAENRKDDSWPEKLLRERLNIQRCFCCMDKINEKQKQSFRRGSLFSPHLESFSFGPHYLESLMNIIRDENGNLPDDLGIALDTFEHFIRDKLANGIISFGSAIDENLVVIPSGDKAAEIYKKYILGEQISMKEKNIVITEFLHHFLKTIGGKGVAQWYLGAMWRFGGRKGRFNYGESYVLVNHSLIQTLINVFKDFPTVKFNLMNCSESLSQQLTIVCRMLPNVSLLGFWWHNFFPIYIEKQISERIEALPANKWILVGTDAYSCEWSYGKISLLKKCLAKILTRKIEDEELKLDEAKFIAQRILYENPREIYCVR